MRNLPALITPTNTELSLSQEFLNSLQTPQDYEQAFQQVTEQKNQMIWWEADLILSYYKKYLKPLDVYRAGQLMNDSTVKYYLRTAAGFPPESRIPNISFNHHYQATMADEFDSKSLQFKGERRYEYAGRSADEELSTRKLKEIIHDDEVGRPKKVEDLPCHWCHNNEGIATSVLLYTIYRSGQKSTPTKLDLHEECFDKWLDTMYEG